MFKTNLPVIFLQEKPGSMVHQANSFLYVFLVCKISWAKLCREGDKKVQLRDLSPSIGSCNSQRNGDPCMPVISAVIFEAEKALYIKTFLPVCNAHCF